MLNEPCIIKNPTLLAHTAATLVSLLQTGILKTFSTVFNGFYISYINPTLFSEEQSAILEMMFHTNILLTDIPIKMRHIYNEFVYSPESHFAYQQLTHRRERYMYAVRHILDAVIKNRFDTSDKSYRALILGNLLGKTTYSLPTLGQAELLRKLFPHYRFEYSTFTNYSHMEHIYTSDELVEMNWNITPILPNMEVLYMHYNPDLAYKELVIPDTFEPDMI